MSAFNLEDVSSKVEDWLEILNRYNDNVNDDDIWSSATGLSYQPQFSNIYQELIMMKIVKHFADEVGVEVSDLDFETYANCQDSSLTIEGTSIYDEDDYDNALEEYRERLEDRDAEENEEDDDENWDDEDEDDE
jgi:hypothetical protein